MRSTRLSSIRRAGLLWLGVLLCAASAHAQDPQVSLNGLPAQPLIGEAICFQADFTNGSGGTGYGPYLIVSVDPLLQQISIDFVDITPRLEKIGDFDASGQLIDPISGTVVTGNEGGGAYLLFYPVGSVETGAPPLTMDVCGVVQTGAEVNVPLELDFTPAFEFGDTPTGDNGAIVGTEVESTVTPQLARVSKANSAPENERPPGPSHVFNYVYAVDVSEGVAIKDLVMEDNLPAELQWTGGAISVDTITGVNCAVTQNPNFPPTPAGLLRVECDSLTGTSATGDMLVSVAVYITDILDESRPDSQAITNVVDLEYNYQDLAYSNTDTSDVSAVHAAAQKTVEGQALPGNTLTYTIDFQLTDYPETAGAGASSFTLTDVLPDGTTFAATLILVVNGTSVPVTPIESPGPGPGETTVVWDIGAAVGSGLPSGTDGRLRYQVDIEDFYSDGVTPVQAADTLTNNVNLSYQLTEGGSGDNGSTSGAIITPNFPRKTIFDPDPLPPQLMPGEEITFRLELAIPAGNTSSVIFVDYLPRPVFDVADFVEATDVVVPPPPYLQVTPLTVTADAASNTITLDYGDIDAPQDSILAVDLKARITSDPFADNLFLTNLFSSSYENADGQVVSDLRAVGLTVGAPELAITKGVLAVDNPNGVIEPAPPADPAMEAVDGEVTGVDAADVITYVITVENIGTQDAYNVVITDPVVSGLDCSAGPVQVEDGDGNPLAVSGDLATGLRLSNPLPGNDGVPVGGGAPFSTDTALIQYDCILASTVTPNRKFTNTASVVWTSTAADVNPFPAQSDQASARIAKPSVEKSVIETTPGYNGRVRSPHIGEMVTFRIEVTVPEGTSPDVQLEDLLDDGLAFVDILSVTGSAGLSTDVTGGFTGVIANASFTAEGTGDTAPDRRLLVGPGEGDYGFGTITNADTDNSQADTVTIEYRTRVLNSINNQNAQDRRNSATWSWLRQGSTRNSVSDRAPKLTIVEPDLRVDKSMMPNKGDQTSPPQVTLLVGHSGGSASDSFDVTLFDRLPFPMVISGAVDESGCAANPPDVLNVSADGKELTAQWDDFPSGDLCTLVFDTAFESQVSAGFKLTNCAQVTWESMADPTLPAPPNNTLAAERTGDPTDTGASANDYFFENCEVFQVFDVGILKGVISTSQPQTDVIPGTPAETESLTIGEQVLFELIVTIPETQTLTLRVEDYLPVTDVVLEYLNIEVISIGDHLTPVDPDPAPIIDDRDGDGINDTVELDFGTVIHQPLDGISDENDRITIEVLALVPNDPRNQNNIIDVNSGIVEFRPDTRATDSYGVEIVEPVLRLDKIADENEVEAGDVINYRVILSHAEASRMSAQDVVVEDMLPSQLKIVSGSVTLGFCSETPDTLQETGDGFLAEWAQFPLAAVCEIDFQATVDVSAVTGNTISNVATSRWSTLDTQGDPNDRLYSENAKWDVIVSPPGLEKFMTATGLGATSFVAGAASHEVAIGETATFNILASFPDGTTRLAEVTDQLPTGSVALEIVDSEILAIGSGLTLSSGAQVGDAAADCALPAPDCGVWVLGTVTNQPDSEPDPDPGDSILFRIQAIVLDDPLNSGAPGEDKDLVNQARLLSPDVTLAAQEVFDIVEPLLEFDKVTESGGALDPTKAGELHRFTLLVNHADESTSPAQDLVITDQLHPDVAWEGDNAVTSTCPRLDILSPPAGTSGTVTFTIESLPLIIGRCSISYDVRVAPDIVVPGLYTNRADLRWESAPGSPESRVGTDSASAALFTFSEAFIEKEILTTSVPETGSDFGDPTIEDVTIGEVIEYQISTFFAEGTTREVVLADVAQQDNAGFLELIGGELVRVGANISANPADPIIAGNTILIDYGTVVNLADGQLDQDDAIIYRLRARVSDVPVNVTGAELFNAVELRFRGPGGISDVRADNISVEVVEPGLTVEKQFVGLSAATATMEFNITNPGTAPAYSVVLVDEFDENIWEPLSLTSVFVPEGYELSATSAAGTTTVQLQVVDATNPSAKQILLPSETMFVSFSMKLRDNADLPVASVENTVDTGTHSIPPPDDLGREVSASDSDTLLFPIKDLEKSWSGLNDPALPGDLLTYRLTLRNTGLAPLSNVLIDDTPDSVGNFQAGSVVATPASGSTITTGNTPGDIAVQVSFDSIGPGSEAYVDYIVEVPFPYPAGQAAPELLTNQGSADSDELEGILSDDPDTTAEDDPTIVPIVADPVMVVQKTNNTLVTQPGEILVYEISYGNAGDQDATGVEITELVPPNTIFLASSSSPGWSCPDGSAQGTVCRNSPDLLAGGGTGLLEFAVQVTATVPANVDRIVNLVRIEEDGVEYDGPSEPSTDLAFDTTLLAAQPDLTVEKDDGGISVVPGQSYLYQIISRNPGVQDATGVVLREVVPDNTIFSAGASGQSIWSCADGSLPGTICTLDVGPLPAGFGMQNFFGLTVFDPVGPDVNLIENRVETNDDGNNSFFPLFDFDSDTTPVVGLPDLVIKKSNQSGAIDVGRELVFAIDYSNVGDRTAIDAKVYEVVPAETQFSSGASGATSWSCADGSPAGTVCEYRAGNIPRGASGSLTFGLRVLRRPITDMIVNEVQIWDDGSNGADPTPDNNVAVAVASFVPREIPVMNLPLLGLMVLVLGWLGACRAQGAHRKKR